MLKILINGIDRTANLIEKSLRISEAVNERSVATISIVDKTGHYRPTVGEIVEVYNGTEMVFAGSIDDLPEYLVEGTNVLMFQNIPIVDFHQSADRRLVADSYENRTAGFIVNDIIGKYLAEEGITAGEIQEGATVQRAVFNYMTASQCFDELSELTGFQWKINPDKTLDFFNRATFTGTPINEQSGIKNLRVKKSRQQYRNRQFIRAGQDISQVQTRTFKGDGETQTFTVDLPIAKVPTIKVNGVTKTVGIRGLDTGFDWYWQKNDKTISQENNDSKLTSSDVLTIEFQGFYPIVVVAENTGEMLSRQNIEGGSGIYESIEQKASIDSRESALAFSEGLLRRFANIQLQVTFETYTRYKAGELVDVSFPSHGINEQMLVAEVGVHDTGSVDHRLIYTVKLVSGESFGGWVNFFKKLAEQNKTFVIRENEIVVKLSSFSDTFTQPRFTDSMTYSIHQYKVCNTNLMCGTGVTI